MSQATDTITVTFDEDIVLSDPNLVKVYDATDPNTALSSVVSANKNTLIISDLQLASQASYYLSIDPNAITDTSASSNLFAGLEGKEYSFTMEDYIGPTLDSGGSSGE